MTMTSTYVILTFIPAMVAADGFAPTARNVKPHVERSMSHHTPQAASKAATKPQCKPKLSPKSLGHWAFASIGGDLGLPEPGTWNELRLRSHDRKYRPT